MFGIQKVSLACSGQRNRPIEELVLLIEHLHELGTTIAIPLAGLLYMGAGFYWMRGTVESQEIAKRMFLNTTLGLAIVLLSGTLIEIVTEPLCGVGQ